MANHSLTKAFVARIEAADGAESDLEDLLTDAVQLANAEAGTVVWFAVKTEPAVFWIFDAFVTESDRQAHAEGEIVAALGENSALLAAQPQIMPADVLAAKMP
jgi:quinol monooxygenase YgiN